MEFSDLWFVYIFLPLTVAIYYVLPGLKARNTFLLIASIVFYALAQPLYLLLFVALTYANYALGLRIEQGNRTTVMKPVAITLGTLVLFKLVVSILGWVAPGSSLTEKLVLPLGISYYTFQLIAYQVDIYRGKHAPASRFSQLLLYAMIFPKVITGPIVRYADFQPQLRRRKRSGEFTFRSAMRFVLGLSKKVLIADYCGTAIETLSSDASGAGAWLRALLFMFQIYFEFSGCTDMAIGMGGIFGFTFCENFDLPYASTSITEFWRRWHISLGSFFRDYVYIPLGGSRKGKLRQILNLFVVWTLTGLWHGTSWNYVLWGVYFFVLLSVEKQLLPWMEGWNKFLRWLLTSFFILIGWVIFSGQGISSLFRFKTFWNTTVSVQLRNSILLLITCVIGSSVIPRMVSRFWRQLFGVPRQSKKVELRWVVYAVSLLGLTVFLLWLCTVAMIGATNAPDIYGGKLR